MKVFEYLNPRIEEREFAQLTVALCNWLYGAHLVWDMGGQQGVKFENEILALRYGNIYYADDELPPRWGTVRTKRPGWNSNDREKKYAALKDYRNAVYDRVLVDRSEICLLETLLFEYDQKTGAVQHSGETRTNDPSGARANHGDLVTATMLAWMLAKEMAEGGRKEKKPEDSMEPGSIGWLLALDEHRNRLLDRATL